ncbi:MAG: efflux RND transporter periplasmic adaptor subunit, partial [Planctomycetota bacterium]
AEWSDSVVVTTRYTGEVRARQRVPLAFDFSGTIESIGADEGDTIDAGALVATLDTDRLQADLARLEASTDATRSDLQLARTTLARIDEIALADAVNEQERDEAVSAVRTLEARLAESVAAERRTRVDIEKSTIRAPFDAIVASRQADVGSLARPGTPVLTLLERSDPEARIGVASDALGALGDAATLTVRGRSLRADVTRVLPEIDRVTRTAQVRLTIDEPLGPTLRDGDPASIALQRTVDERGVWVPVSALTQSVRGLWALYIAHPNDDNDGWTLVRREVEVVRPASDRAYVRGAVAEGELIVIDGKQRLVPGIAVRPSDAPPAGADASLAKGAS